MEAKNIRSLNSAVYVMRHFVELSAKLLPIYERITRNEPHSVHSEEDKKRIEVIYQTYDINPKTGEFLLGSNIVALIKKARSEEHTSELQSRPHLVCRLLLEKKNKTK